MPGEWSLMREKKWIDCPVCGAKNCMQRRKDISESFDLPAYPPVAVTGLDGQFCSACGDGFWSLNAERSITRQLMEHMAAHDATRVVASEIASVQEAAEALHLSVQGVHKMMQEGRLRYVPVAGRRLPLRTDIAEKVQARQHPHRSPPM